MALGTNLPTWPAIVFTYFEPVSLLIGFCAAFFNPASFVSRQLPPSPTLISSSVPPHAHILSLSIANMFLVQCLLSILFTVVTRERRLTRYYLAAAAIGDLGHIYASYKVMGSDTFWDFAGYNDMMFGNVAVSVFLWINRALTLLGVFGRVGRLA